MTTGKHPPQSSTKSPAQPTPSIAPLTQRQMETHQRVPMGQTQGQLTLEKDTQGTQHNIQALNIVEFLIKNGPAFAADQLRRDLHFFRTMESYQAYEEGSDRGAPSK